MKKSYLFILLALFVLVTVSCNMGDSKETTDKTITVEGSYDVRNLTAGDSVTLIIDKNDVVTLPECSVSNGYIISTTSSKSLKETNASTNLAPTSLGDKIVIPHTNADNNQFTGNEFVSGSGTVTVEVHHMKSSNDLVITTNEINAIGRELGAKQNDKGYYQDLPIKEYYYIQPSELGLSNLNEVAIFQQPMNMGGEHYDYGFIKNDSVSLVSSNNNIYGIVNLGITTSDSIGLFNSIEADCRSNAALKLFIESPVTLEKDTAVAILKSDSVSGQSFVYKIKKPTSNTEKEYVIEITKNSSLSFSDFEIFDGWGLGDARYIGTDNNGKRRSQMLAPIKKSGNTILLYVGTIEDDFIFNIVIDKEVDNYGSIKLREYNSTTDGTSFAVVTEADINGKTLTLSPDNGVVSFIIKNTDTANNYYYSATCTAGEDVTVPEMEFNKRGTNRYSCNGSGVDNITTSFSSQNDLGQHHKGVQKNSTVIVFVEYEKSTSTTPVSITMSFGQTYTT